MGKRGNLQFYFYQILFAVVFFLSENTYAMVVRYNEKHDPISISLYLAFITPTRIVQRGIAKRYRVSSSTFTLYQKHFICF